MWQSGCWVEVWQGGNHNGRPNDLWLGGIWPHRKPWPVASRAGTMRGWNGHAAQNHCRTQQENGLIEAPEVIWVRQRQDLNGTIFLCYCWTKLLKKITYYLLLLSEVADLRSPGSPKPLVPDLLSHRVAGSIPEINTSSAITSRPPLSSRGWVKLALESCVKYWKTLWLAWKTVEKQPVF